MPALSLCMIVKNEEDFIEQCLTSVKGLVDEIIIVDTGSSDKTKELARKFTQNIYDFKWIDDFSAARNESLKYATGDWILILDADEIILSEDNSKIKDAIEKHAQSNAEVEAYSFVTYNYTNNSSVSGWVPFRDPKNKFAGFYPSVKVRLFCRIPSIHFQGAIHELVEPTIPSNRIKKLDVVVHHYGALKPARNTYLELAKRKADESPSAKSYYELGIEYKESGDFANAEQSFKKSIDLEFKDLTWLNLAIVCQKQDKLDEAIASFSKLNSADAFFGLGFCYFKKGDLNKSASFFEKAVLLKPDFVDALVNLGAVYEKLGRYEEALKHLVSAISISQVPRAYYNLGVLYEKIGRKQDAVASYKKALSLGYTQNKVIERLKLLGSDL